ncbi:MAG: hypothetical protein A2096_06505 [Spirochaetes bacterium GWF1_41_5]|nr:MAG: hypothetical protein A2096_06505 [Spirochaetes bacterium GWF1_41_5]
MKSIIPEKLQIIWVLPMKRVFYALLPLLLFSIYLYGWRSLVLSITVCLCAYLTELAFSRSKVHSSALVTGLLFTLSLPPTLPLWIAWAGIVFGMVFGKMVFGGFGKNIFNPALIGRAFIYVSFGSEMTARWAVPAAGFPGGFIKYSLDALSAATPLHTGLNLADFTGLTAGSLGESSALLILLGGFYLIIKKTVNPRIIFSGLAAFLLMETAFFFTGISSEPPFAMLIKGGFLFGIFFMATDPVSASQHDLGRIVYGALIGMLTVLIRKFSVWPEGFMFACLLGNMIAPITDYTFNLLEKKTSA